jgi:penicillin-binding protein 1C
MRRRWKSILITLLVLAAVGWWGVPWLVPLPEALLKPPPASTLYLARDGTPLRHLLNEDGTRSAPPVTYAEIPTTLVHAMLAAEDKRFFSHGGVDPLAIARAAWDNAQAKRIVSGASTIHQQLIKNTTPRSGKRTLGVKIVEALQARRLAMSWNREDVLTAYLNRISFGNLMTGAATAASGYFHKPLNDLTPAECALLAALPQSPSRLNPFRSLEAVLPRQRAFLITCTRSAGSMTSSIAVALSQNIVLQRFSGGFEAPHAVEMLRGAPRPRRSAPRSIPRFSSRSKRSSRSAWSRSKAAMSRMGPSWSSKTPPEPCSRSLGHAISSRRRAGRSMEPGHRIRPARR